MTVGGHEGWPAGGGRGAVPAGAMQNARQPQQVADVRYHHTDAQTVIMQISLAGLPDIHPLEKIAGKTPSNFNYDPNTNKN